MKSVLVSLLVGCFGGHTLLPATYAFAIQPQRVPAVKKASSSSADPKFAPRTFTVRHSSIPTASNEEFPSAASTTSTSELGINGATKEESAIKQEDSTIKQKLRQVSNVASILCVLDCTILPIVTVVLPLLGILDLGADKLAFLHQLGHSIALFFVMPVGSLTSILNYLSHKKTWITALAVLGLTMIGLANSHIHHLPAFLSFGEAILHNIQHGMLHRVVNILGCSFLLGSNYLSQKQGCAHHDHSDGCTHDHSHKHEHAH
eukprot:scaffold1727_cov133-Cylindrotheca_fusiformis.AAC.52